VQGRRFGGFGCGVGFGCGCRVGGLAIWWVWLRRWFWVRVQGRRFGRFDLVDFLLVQVQGRHAGGRRLRGALGG
jgi:hypothetical protein